MMGYAQLAMALEIDTVLKINDAATPQLDNAEKERYGRHLILPEVGLAGQRKLKAAKVLLVGAGGLGSPLGLYLAAAGIGTLGLVDDDRVETSNLQRQVLFGSADVGRSKIDAACERLREVNPHIALRPHPVRARAANILELIDGYDIIVDGSDNFTTRYLINDACVLTGKPDVWGAVQRFEGQVAVFWRRRGACYRCLFPEPPPAHLVPSCAEGGVLGVLPGIIGALQANEVIKLVLAKGEPLIARLVIFDALRGRFRELRLQKSPSCPICATTPSPDATRESLQARLHDLEELCSAPADDRQPTREEDRALSNPETPPFEISVQQLETWRQDGTEHLLVDVRELVELDVCRIDDSRSIPLRELPQKMDELDSEQLIVVHCHHGGRSAQAVAYLRQQGFAKATNLRGGINAWSLEIDPAVPRY